MGEDVAVKFHLKVGEEERIQEGGWYFPTDTCTTANVGFVAALQWANWYYILMIAPVPKQKQDTLYLGQVATFVHSDCFERSVIFGLNSCHHHRRHWYQHVRVTFSKSRWPFPDMLTQGFVYMYYFLHQTLDYHWLSLSDWRVPIGYQKCYHAAYTCLAQGQLIFIYKLLMLVHMHGLLDVWKQTNHEVPWITVSRPLTL